VSKASHFGRNLRELRERSGLTQAQLAERAGLHPQGVVKLERGEREPAWATVVALAEALDVDCRAFLADLLESASELRRRGRPPRQKPAQKPTAKRRRRT
jgi:transcriptional regulator with XRE-family HTH domain